jgi:8-oxo-dGTP pyrophosphatase MutT (NUDIX family)
MTTQFSPEITDRSYGIIALRYISSNSLPTTTTTTTAPPPNSKTTEILLILQKTLSTEHHPSGSFWTLPKGHPEPSDQLNILSTAIRELFEETSLIITPSDILLWPQTQTQKGSSESNPIGPQQDGSFFETYVDERRKPGKQVRYWVAVARGEEGRNELVVQEKEVVTAAWYPWEEGIEMMRFKEGKEVLRRVRECLDDEGGKVEVGRTL